MTGRHRFRSRIASLGAAFLIVQLTAVVALAAPGVTPASVTATLLPGGSTTVAKTVETPPIPPNPDIVFVADTTSSMSGAIGNVQTNAAATLATVLAAQPSAQFGVAHYTDQACPDRFVLDLAITADTTAVVTALNGLATPNNDMQHRRSRGLHQRPVPAGHRSGGRVPHRLHEDRRPVRRLLVAQPKRERQPGRRHLGTCRRRTSASSPSACRAPRDTSSTASTPPAMRRRSPPPRAASS